ncbi:MAG TPA: bifunctional DNA-binding transcriptional regulator/O6-methylguanine-DNA methyltransferase Ada [Burkholderiales bacterium]|nr:bifunctional DNA-binding transcriptional regulator/O6-methylguanine-DNA methyltransferase Ada [Burkholderiales bacterium]
MNFPATNTTTDPERLSTDSERWAAVRRRDASADGLFYYGVTTTGVYCRPSCAARLPRRENVSFYPTRAQAEQAGLRPCKRCRPDQPALAEQHAAAVTAACRLIQASEEPPRLQALAAAAGMSRFHFHRVFKALTGLTPKAYANAQRAQRARAQLPRSETVTEAIYAAGFNSSGRFYAACAEVLGMTPSRFRAGGAGTCIRFAVGECSLGAILVAATEKGVCAILLGGDPEPLVRDLQARFPRAQLAGGDRDFEQWVARVIGFVEAPRIGLDLPLDVRGTAFQQRVWQALRKIPPGATATYAEIARRVGAPRAARAVARACAANPLAVAIPCHRVVRNDGALAGYRWGVERKRALLERERR